MRQIHREEPCSRGADLGRRLTLCSIKNLAMKTKSILHFVILAALASFGITALNAQTTYLYKGTTDTNWANAANWNGTMAPTGTVVYGRITVTNLPAFPISYLASMGTTVYTNSTGNRALVIGSPANTYGSMIIMGGTWESRGVSQDVIGNAAGVGILTVAGGNYAFTNFGAKTLEVPLSASPGTLNVNSGSVSVDTLSQGHDSTATGGSSTINLNGGTLAVKVITDYNSGINSTNNFNGGKLVALAASANFVNADALNVLAGGAVIDSQSFAITITKQFRNWVVGLDGGLTKLGTGSLTLTGTNNYTGPTLVSGGSFTTTTTSTGGGAYTNTGGTALGVTLASVGTTLAMSAWQLGDVCTNNFNLGSFGNASAPLIRATNLNLLGTSRVFVTGSGFSVGQFPLIKYTTVAGLTDGTFIKDTLPSGVEGYISNNVANSSIDLVITSAPFLVWRGLTNGVLVAAWDLNTTSNWLDSIALVPKYFTGTESVRFDDTLTGTNYVNVTAALSPGSTLVTNANTNYTFGGTGRISGAGRLVKDGAGVLTLATTNDYTGITRIIAGTLKLGVTNSLPSGAGKSDVTVDGTLDLNGCNQSLNGLAGSGMVKTTLAGMTNTLTLGINNTGNTFSGSLQDGGGVLTVTKLGSGAQTLSGPSSTYSGGTLMSAGTLLIGGDNALGVGLLTYSAGTLAADGVALRTLTNAVVLSNNPTLGTSGNAGVLKLAGPLDVGGATRNFTVDSPAILSGNSFSTNGGLGSKLGASTLTLQSNMIYWIPPMEVNNGTLIVDGSVWTNGGSLRANCNVASGVATLAITNGALVVLTNPVSVLRAGNATGGGNPTATNVIEVAGTLTFPRPGTAYTDGKVLIGQSSARGILNLRSGGLLVARNIERDSSSSGTQFAEVNFDGGTLKPSAGDYVSTFLQGLTVANVLNGGAVIDTTNYNVTIAQPLTAVGSGGLTKYGSGTLYLTGTNNYTGLTVVSAGRLVMPSFHAGGGAVTVNDGATLNVRPAAAGATLSVSTLTLGSSTAATVELDWSGLGNPTLPLITANSLSTIGTVTLSITTNALSVGQYPLIAHTGPIGGAGFGAFALPPLPRGLGGYLSNNLASVDLVITNVTPVLWVGATTNRWDVGTTVEWLFSGTPTAYLQGDTVRLDDSVVTYTNINMVATLTPNWVTVSNQVRTIYYLNNGGGKFSGGMGLTKDGTGSLALTTPNDFVGPVRVNGGTIIIGNGTALGANSGVTIANGGQVDLHGIAQSTRRYTYYITGAGPDGQGAIKNGGADLSENGGISNLVLQGDATLGTFGTGGNLGRFDLGNNYGSVNGNGFKLTKAGPGWIDIRTLATTNLTELIINGGYLYGENVDNNLGTNITVNAGAMLGAYGGRSNIARISLNGGSLMGSGAGSSIWAGLITLSGSCTSGVALASTGAGDSHLRVLNTVSGSGSLTKSGTNTLFLSTTPIYTGDTIITGGTLALLSSGFLASTNISVGSGAVLDASATTGFSLAAGRTLSGAGTVLGDVTNSAGSFIRPGSSVGTLTLSSNLVLNGGSLFFEIGAVTNEGGTYNDLLNVGRDLTLTSLTVIKLETGGFSIDTSNPYTLINYTGALVGNTNNLVVTSDTRFTFALDFSVTNKVRVIVTGGGASDLTWYGEDEQPQAAWDLITSPNWRTGPDSFFYQGDRVVFGDSSSSLTANLAGILRPGSISVIADNEGWDYTFAGAGLLSGGTGLTKGKSRALTIANSGLNDYTGPTLISGGDVRIGTGSILGNLSPNTVVTITNSDFGTYQGRLIFNRSDTITVGNTFLGDGPLIQQGPGVLALTANNTSFNGPIVITSGTLQLGNAGALGTTTSGTFATNGGTLDLNSLMLGDEVVTIEGVGAGGQGALINSPASFTANYGLRFLTLAGNATIGGKGRFDVKNTPTVLGNGYTLSKVGTNAVIIDGAGNTGFGDINLTDGMIQIQGNTTLGNAANPITVGANGTFGFYGSSATINKTLAINGGRLWVRNGSATLSGTATLTGNALFQVDATALTMLGAIGGTGSLTKAGTGYTYLYGAGSSWSGGTLVSGGVLYTGASDALVGLVTNNATVAFLPASNTTITCSAGISGSGSVASANAALGTTLFTGTNTSAGGTAISAGTLEIGNNGLLTGLVTVNSGRLVIDAGGAVHADTLAVGQNFVNSTNLVLAGGSLSVGSGLAHNLFVGYRTINIPDGPRGLLDVSAASSFTANVGNLLVGASTESSTIAAPRGILLLATNNTITATNIAFGHVLLSGGFDNTLTNLIQLGGGTNSFQTPSLVVGGNKMSATLTLPTGGTFLLNNGSAPADFAVGSSHIQTGANPNALADLSAGTFLASLNNWTVGLKDKGPDANSGSGIVRAAMTLGTSPANNVTASSVLIGALLDGVGGGSYGTLTVGGGQFFVTNNVTIGSLAGTGTASGTLNLNGSTFTVGGDILDAGGTSTLVLDGATLDLMPAGRTTNGLIGSVLNPINSFTLRSGTLRNIGEINGGAAIAKTGTGTLVVAGNNTWTGTTTISEGTLAGTGILNAQVIVQSGATFAPGTSIGMLTINNTLSLAGSTVMEVNKTGGVRTCDLVQGITTLTCGGTLTVLASGEALVEGDTFTLFTATTFAGGFSGFNLPALDAGLAWDTTTVATDGVLRVGKGNLASGQIVLQGFAGTAHAGNGLCSVTFTATGTGGVVLGSWTESLPFVNGSATYTLPTLPLNTVAISAKTLWTLRKKLPVSFTGGIAALDFSGATGMLLGGDLDNSNMVDIGDYFRLAAVWYQPNAGADIDGSGLVDIDDYFIMASNWYLPGDAL